MAVKHIDVTIGAAATPITSTGATRKGVRHIILQVPGQNSVYVGDSTVTSTSYGYAIAGTGSLHIGPFSGDAPLSTAELYLKGTLNDVVHALVITH